MNIKLKSQIILVRQKKMMKKTNDKEKKIERKIQKNVKAGADFARRSCDG